MAELWLQEFCNLFPVDFRRLGEPPFIEIQTKKLHCAGSAADLSLVPNVIQQLPGNGGDRACVGWVSHIHERKLNLFAFRVEGNVVDATQIFPF